MSENAKPTEESKPTDNQGELEKSVDIHREVGENALIDAIGVVVPGVSSETAKSSDDKKEDDKKEDAA